MAHVVVWLHAAIDDLESIRAYIAEDSPTYARAVVRGLLSAARLLADFPLMGRVVPEWQTETVRERIVYPYRLIYRVSADRVDVLAVIHGARLLPAEAPATQ